MTRLNREMKSSSNQNYEVMKSTVNFTAFQKISAKSRDLVGKELVAGRYPANIGKFILP
jgi:hypothetical protein